jgi:hypothetical protein
MGEGSAALQKRGRAACSGGEGSLMTQSADSVTTQSMAFKFVMASEPYRYVHLIFKTGHGRVGQTFDLLFLEHI